MEKIDLPKLMKKLAPVIIYPDDKLESVKPQNGTDFKLEEVQRVCEGNVEVVFDNGEVCMIANEDAFALCKMPNRIASLIATPELRYNVLILGTVLLCPSKMFK